MGFINVTQGKKHSAQPMFDRQPLSDPRARQTGFETE